MSDRQTTTRLRASKACERCRSRRRKCSPPFPCRQCIATQSRCIVRSKARCRPRRTSKRSPTGSEDYAATPDMDIVCSVVGSITPPSIDFDFGVEASPDAELIEPVAEELIVPRNSSPLATEQVESILVATAASVLNHKVHLPKLREPLPIFFEPIHVRQRMASNGAVSEGDLSFADALSLLQGLSLQHGFYTLFMDHARLLSNLSELEGSGGDHIPMYEHALGHPQGTITSDSLSMLYAALALGGLRTGPMSERYAYIDQLFQTSKQLLDMYTGRSSFDVAAALFLQHLFAVTTSSTNHGKSIVSQAVQACHELKLNRFNEERTTIRGTWLYLLVYMADVYSSTSHATPPIIKSNDFDQEIFEYLRHVDADAGPIIDMVSLNHEVFTSLHGNNITLENVRRLESKRITISSFNRVIQQGASGSHENRKLITAQILSLARIHMYWSRIMLRAKYISTDIHFLPSITICFRSAQIILTSYHELSVCESNPALHLVSWRQLERTTIASYITLIAYLQNEALQEETQIYLNKALDVLNVLSQRFDVAIEVKKTILSLGRESCLCLSDVVGGMRSVPEDAAHNTRPLNMFYDPMLNDEVLALGQEGIENWIDFSGITGVFGY